MTMPAALAAENALMGAPQFASMAMPAAHAVNIAAPTAAATSGGGGSSFLSSIIPGGWKSQVLPAGLNLLNAAITSKSARDAAKIQAQYGNRALDFEMGRYNDAKSNFQPYVQGGAKAYANLGDVLSTPRSYTSDLERLARGGR